MTDAKQPAHFDWATELSDAQGHVTLSEQEAHEIGARLRASHGQAPAQAAPAYKDSTPELHIGDSAFESWYSTYSPAHKSDKQRARDAYAAGMGDPLVTAAPAAVAGPVAVLKFERGTPGRENEMPRVVSCNWMPDGEYEVYLAAAPTTQPSHKQEESKPHGWLYDWTLICATGKPDTTYTGFTKDEAHARKHDNCTAIYTAPQPVVRELLTDEQIDQAIAELGLNYLADAHATNRAVLRKLCHHAHGIKGGQHD